MVDTTGTTTWCYDAHGNVTLKRQVIAGNTYATGYSWNAADRLVGMTYPDGATVTYTRDADGRIASLSATPVGGISTAVVSAIGYLPFGPVTTTWCYDAHGNVTLKRQVIGGNRGIASNYVDALCLFLVDSSDSA